MTGLHIESRPMLEIIQESLEVNLMFHKTWNPKDQDPGQKAANNLHIDELQQLHEHVTELLKD